MPHPPQDNGCPIFDVHGNVSVDKFGRVIVVRDENEDPPPQESGPPSISWQPVVLILLGLVFGIAQWVIRRELNDVHARLTKLETTIARNNDRITTIETLWPMMRERIDGIAREAQTDRNDLAELAVKLETHSHGRGQP